MTSVALRTSISFCPANVMDLHFRSFININQKTVWGICNKCPLSKRTFSSPMFVKSCLVPSRFCLIEWKILLRTICCSYKMIYFNYRNFHIHWSFKLTNDSPLIVEGVPIVQDSACSATYIPNNEWWLLLANLHLYSLCTPF